MNGTNVYDGLQCRSCGVSLTLMNLFDNTAFVFFEIIAMHSLVAQGRNSKKIELVRVRMKLPRLSPA